MDIILIKTTPDSSGFFFICLKKVKIKFNFVKGKYNCVSFYLGTYY